MEVITRRYYADIVDSWIGKGNIVAIVGSRRDTISATSRS